MLLVSGIRLSYRKQASRYLPTYVASYLGMYVCSSNVAPLRALEEAETHAQSSLTLGVNEEVYLHSNATCGHGAM